MAIYNMSLLENSTNLVHYTQIVTSNLPNPDLYGLLAVMIFWFVVFVASYNGEFAKSLMTSSLATCIITVLLAYSTLISYNYIPIPFVVFALATAAYYSAS